MVKYLITAQEAKDLTQTAFPDSLKLELLNINDRITTAAKKGESSIFVSPKVSEKAYLFLVNAGYKVQAEKSDRPTVPVGSIISW